MSNRLPILAAEIRQAHIDTKIAIGASVKAAMAAGIALLEAKELSEHGAWLLFLTDAGVPERTAQRYIKLASSGLQSDFVSDLGGVTPGLRFLSLRTRAVELLGSAEAAARANLDDTLTLPPLEAALEIIDEMVGMFPNYSGVPA